MASDRRTTSDMRARVVLAVGDVAMLVLFTVIGLVNHKDGVTLSGLAEVVVPIAGVGAVCAAAFATYRRPSVRTLLPAWAIAVPAGILIRKALFHTPESWSKTGVFIGVALAFSLLFLLAWRAAARLVLRPRAAAGSG